MAKQLTIERCCECRYARQISVGVRDESRTVHTCLHPTGPHRMWEDIDTWSAIHPLCPLPDAPAWPVVPSEDVERDEGACIEVTP